MTAENRRDPLYAALLAISGMAALAAVLTLIPWPGASWPNIIGYSSLCTFAPGATFACALIAGSVCTARARLVKRSTGPIFVPAIVLGLLILGLVFSTVRWAEVKAQYAQDATTGATAGEAGAAD